MFAPRRHCRSSIVVDLRVDVRINMDGPSLVAEPVSRCMYAMAVAYEKDLPLVIGGHYETLRFKKVSDFYHKAYLDSCGRDGTSRRLIYEDAGVEVYEDLYFQLEPHYGKHIVFIRCHSRVVQLVLSNLYGVIAGICGYSLAGDLLFSSTFDIYQRLYDVSMHCYGYYEQLRFCVGLAGSVSNDKYIHELFGITRHRIFSKVNRGGHPGGVHFAGQN